VDDRNLEKQHVNQSLANCGYPNWAIKNATSERTQHVIANQPRGFATFPYVQGLSENLQRICKDFGIKVAHRPINTLRELLVHPKDKQDKDHNSGVVYGIRCEGNNCSEYYIGETEQPIKKRMYQHRRAAGEGTSSAVFNHLHSSGHTFKDENVEIICKEHNWFERGVKEANYVKCRNPSINKHGGVRHLSTSARDENLRSFSRPPVRRRQIHHSINTH
jgi:hypothetical protein